MVSKILLSKIHAQFRSLRNGEVADLLRQYGVSYRLAFGVQSYQLKAVAEWVKTQVEEEVLQELAETLWAEDIRESKMLAARLFPAERMDQAMAERWIAESPYKEITDQLVMHLLCRLPFATQLAEREDYCGQMLRKRLEP